MSYKKNKDISKGKGRRLWLGEQIYSIPCRAIAVLPRTILKEDLHQDDLKEKDEFILFFKIVQGKIASAARIE